ncbi:aminotransferase class V-fold PLP-dependent enzyme [Acidisphaera sp. L21]|uniref:aminotransferase class V-fold PLP-dependent enzyme n=1 Tax=Acidisphaera sp. L21 TaxID=1641851 RepID=UPI00131B266D|nr:aminotransferase class V-fold PLP-dependent enzyme [Acidisphaera sp. L21]
MLPSQRHLFDIPRDVAYFNNGSYTPLPRSVREAGEAGVAVKSMPWLMDHDAIAQRVEAVRTAAAGFIGASPDDMAIIHSAAYGVATAAANLDITADTRILLIEGEFPSQSLEWARRAELTGAMIDLVPRPDDGDWTAALLQRIEQPGLPPVGIAALTPLVWTDGTLIDIERLAPALRQQGAAIIIDATQAAGVLSLDVTRLGADYLVFPTYKWLLGPYTLAFMYVAPARQNGTPLEQYGTNRIDGGDPFAGHLGASIPTARRFDMGQRNNPVSLPMGLAGMELLHQWGTGPLGERLRATTDGMAEHAEIRGFRAIPRPLRAPHILGLRTPPGLEASVVVPALAARGVHVAERGGNIRIGAHAYNDDEDVARFADAIASFA